MSISRLARHVDPVTVLLVAAPHRFTDLAGHLPSGWRVTRAQRNDVDPDIVVYDNADPRGVTSLCHRYPGAGVVAVIGPFSDHNRVVDVLDAGADACVRSDSTGVLAAHVQACQRRHHHAA